MASLWRPSARAEQLRPSQRPPTAARNAFFTCPANDCRRLRKQGQGRCSCCDDGSSGPRGDHPQQHVKSAFFTCPANDCRRLRKQGQGRRRCCDDGWWMFSRKHSGLTASNPSSGGRTCTAASVRHSEASRSTYLLLCLFDLLGIFHLQLDLTL